MRAVHGLLANLHAELLRPVEPLVHPLVVFRQYLQIEIKSLWIGVGWSWIRSEIDRIQTHIASTNVVLF